MTFQTFKKICHKHLLVVFLYNFLELKGDPIEIQVFGRVVQCRAPLSAAEGSVEAIFLLLVTPGDLSDSQMSQPPICCSFYCPGG